MPGSRPLWTRSSSLATLAVERQCCEFFRLEYDAAERLLTARVDVPELDPALDALRYALTS